MTYQRELDDLPWEATKDAASAFAFWPKVFGENVLCEHDPLPTATVHDPSGAQIGTATVSAAAVGTPSVSRLIITVPAIATLGEDYSLRITWRLDGEAADQNHTDVRLFDVVRYPFGNPTTSLNDLLEERPDCGRELERLGRLLGFDAADARERMAAVFIVQARIELETWVRSAIRDGRGGAAGEAGSATSYVGQSTTGASYTRPNLILNRERLGRVERPLAMAALYTALADDPTGEGDANSGSKLAVYYRGRASQAWAALGPLKFDTTDEQLRVAETVTDSRRRVTYTRRTQS